MPNKPISFEYAKLLALTKSALPVAANNLPFLSKLKTNNWGSLGRQPLIPLIALVDPIAT